MKKELLSVMMAIIAIIIPMKSMAQEPYAVLSDNNTVLTFYYDNNKAARNGMDVGPFLSYEHRGWSAYRDTITTIVFDASFANCTTLTSTAFWFCRCTNLTTIAGISNLNTSNVTNMSNMFSSCSSLTDLDVSNFNTANVTNMGDMFAYCTSLTTLDLSNFDTSSVVSFYNMFLYCRNLTNLNLSGFNTENVTNMFNMFYGCSNLTNLDVTGFNTQNVTDMSFMFYGCSNLTSLDLNEFNTENVTNMYNMLGGCSGLTSLDLSKFNTANVTSMVSMFSGCSGLTSLDLSGFNTENVTNMSWMFDGCSGLTSLDVTGFNTQNMTNTSGMFYRCSGLTSLDVTGFNTQNVTDMSWMFNGCSSLTTIYAGNEWNIAAVTNSDKIFFGCTNIVGGAGTHYDANHTDHAYAHIDGGVANPGYFTAKMDPEAKKEELLSRLEVIKQQLADLTNVINTMQGGSGVEDIVMMLRDTEAEVAYVEDQVNNASTDDELNECEARVSELEQRVQELYRVVENYKPPVTQAEPYAIDLGLPSGTKWASWNVGASKPEEFGGYYAWGETEEKDTYTWDNYLYGSYNYEDGTSQMVDIGSDIGGTDYDVAHVKWGGDWRLPSIEHINELRNNCSYEWTTLNGVNGCRFTGPNGNTIFLPAVGRWRNGTFEGMGEWGDYQSSSKREPESGEAISVFSEGLLFNSENPEWWYANPIWGQYCGRCVRPIIPGTSSEAWFDGLTARVNGGASLDDAFAQVGGREVAAQTIAAIVWKNTTALTADMLQGINNPNLLVYVNEASLAPQGIQNVVINGQAKEIILTDATTGNNNFFCPQAFRAEKISYTRNFRQATQIGISRGWEGIALPFNVQTITHETKGALAPFGTGTGVKHFWLRAYDGENMYSAQQMEAYAPYVIAMPNSNDYYADYNLAGRVTFSATNTEVYETPDFSFMENEPNMPLMTVPAFQRKAQSDSIYAINVGQARGNYAEGSVFEKGLREVRPFEIYTVHHGQGARPRFIPITAQGDESTGISLTPTLSEGEGEWYDLSGRKLSGEPKTKGVYINKGKKVLR